MGATVAHHGGRRRWRSNNRPAAAMIIAALTTLLFVASIATFIARLPTTSAAAAEQQQRPPPRFPLGPSAPNIRSSLLEEVLTPPASLGDDICRPTGQIEDACCDYETVEKSLNTPKFFATLENLVKTNYFRFYKVDLYRDCPFWVENGLCMNRACTVEKASESEIPEEYRSTRLSSVHPAHKDEVVFPSSEEIASSSPSGTDTCQDTDFCYWAGEDLSSESVWVDLIKNPERFTGYAGPGANRVWKAIYEENCFGSVPKGSFLEPARAKGSGGGSGFVGREELLGGSSPAMGGFGGGLGGLIPSLAAPVDPAAEEQCLEKRVFYRVISGLHASISTHICHEYLNQTTGTWSPNLECFITRIAQHPERLQNVYFNYVLLVRALARAGDYLTTFNLKPGHGIPASEKGTIDLLQSLVGQASSCPPTFDEASLFKPSNPEAPQLKREFRDHFRNVSLIMDCVGCDKCRLWGKMQVNGLGTAMKILFSFDEEDFDPRKNPALLERSELVALINTLHRFAESLKAVETFRGMYQQGLRDKGEEKKKSEKAKQKVKPPSSPRAGSASSKAGGGPSSRPESVKAGPPLLSLEAVIAAARGYISGAAEACKTSATACLSWARGRLEGWRRHGLSGAAGASQGTEL